MSYYTSTGLTVSSEHAEEFLRILAKPGNWPDIAARTRSGAVTAVWKDRNHFDVSDTYDEIEAFLESTHADYAMEVIDEDWNVTYEGTGELGFWTSVEYHVHGDPIDPKTITMNRAPVRKSPTRKPATKRTPTARKTTAKRRAPANRAPAARRAPARRKTAGARR